MIFPLHNSGNIHGGKLGDDIVTGHSITIDPYAVAVPFQCLFL